MTKPASAPERCGFPTLLVADGTDAVALARAEKPALSVLDLMLPDLNGFEVCRALRRETATADSRSTSQREHRGGGPGNRPRAGCGGIRHQAFQPARARVANQGSLARRQNAGVPAVFRCGALTVDLPRHEVMLGEQRLALTAIEFKLLAVLVHRRGYLLSRAQLLQEAWHFDSGP